MPTFRAMVRHNGVSAGELVEIDDDDRTRDEDVEAGFLVPVILAVQPPTEPKRKSRGGPSPAAESEGSGELEGSSA